MYALLQVVAHNFDITCTHCPRSIIIVQWYVKLSRSCLFGEGDAFVWKKFWRMIATNIRT